MNTMHKPQEGKRNIIVIGASAGGIGPLIELVNQMPAKFDAAVFVVQHVAPFSPSHLPQILERSGKLPVMHAKDGEPIKMGRIYVAPPDFHLLIDEEKVVVKKGPKENRFRPSIDALFRSAAYTYGERVISIVLSGMLDDGTSGMWTVKRLGGVTMIQDPDDAICPSMPHHVMEYVDVDHKLPVSEMGSVLLQLIREDVNPNHRIPEAEMERLRTEISIASQDNSFQMGIVQMGEPSSLTCPECAGALSMLRDGNLTRYRCHTGHAFTHNSLLASASKSMEANMWKAVKSFEEMIILLQDSARQLTATGNTTRSEEYKRQAEYTKKRSAELRRLIFQVEALSDDNIAPDETRRKAS
jgi:two-component system, chemotaxis family, protein-glutamate methylesterase/glutaminase